MSKKDMFNYFKYDYFNFAPLIQQIDNELKDEPYASTTRTFNWSLIKINEDTYLYAVRFGATFVPEAPLFKPGNSEKCINPMEIGHAYWWNRWQMGFNVGGTYFFIGNHLTNKFQHCRVELDDDIKNTALTQDYPYRLFNSESNYFSMSDVRVITQNNQHWVHDNKLQYIYPIKIEGNTIKFGIKINNSMEGGQNYPIIKLTDNELVHLDWYYPEGVKIISKNIVIRETGTRGYQYTEKKTKSANYIWIKYDDLIENGKKKFIMNGAGSYDTKKPEDMEKYGHNYGKMPLFSFTTPHIPLSDDGKIQLGVGHIKIHTDTQQYPYLPESRIQVFRDNLYRDMKAMFGDRYIRHKGSHPAPDCYGYIYMLYFYILYDTNEIAPGNQPALRGQGDMRLSDAFLPVYLDPKAPDSPKDNDFKFSLIFPMGLAKHNDKIIVTCGEGDFYSVALEFNIQDVVDSCIHNVKQMDMDQYKYYIMAYRDKKLHVVEKLSEMMTGGNNYRHKYLKYKSKYLALKNKI